MKHPGTAAFGHRVWPARAGALTPIRREVRWWLAPLDVIPEAEADLVLAVNEAAANVIDHAYRTGADTGGDTDDGRAVVEVFFWTEPGAVLLEVVDHGQWRPPGPHAAGRGYGIAIMHRLVEAVLIHHDARGTRVLLRHSLPARPLTLLPHAASSAARVGDL